jgi:hypothetical protein
MRATSIPQPPPSTTRYASSLFSGINSSAFNPKPPLDRLRPERSLAIRSFQRELQSRAFILQINIATSQNRPAILGYEARCIHAFFFDFLNTGGETAYY